jgi:long-chain acyl-CoA synthetase
MKYKAGLTNRIQSIDGVAGTDWNNDINVQRTDYISLQNADTIGGLFQERVRRTPGKIAYIQYSEDEHAWQEISWLDMAKEVARWQAAFKQEGLKVGDRVSLMLRNCVEWVMFDLAAQGLGLVTVPIYTNDRAENIGQIVEETGVRLLFLETDDQWTELQQIHNQISKLDRIVTIEQVDPKGLDEIVKYIDDWLPNNFEDYSVTDISTDALASIVYTTGTTGSYRAVMLSHRNILWNIEAGLSQVAMYTNDILLSFLPLSHTLERTVGYYMPIVAGAEVAYCRSIPQLGADLVEIKPTVMVSVPRIFEKVYAKTQDKLHAGSKFTRNIFRLTKEAGWRQFEYEQKQGRWSPLLLLWPLLEKLVASKMQEKLGGRLRFAISGGAALPEKISRLFIGLGIPIIQGYGLTEASPIISTNSLANNIPSSAGTPLPGVEVKIGSDNELLTRSPSVMLGYWNNEQATKEVIDEDGWLHTGDKARIENGQIYITGRIKETIVLSNGEKVSPSDMEMSIILDPLFEQAIVLGEGKPFLSALVVLNHKACEKNKIKPSDTPETQKVVLRQIAKRIEKFPGHVKIPKATVISEPWGVENGLMTPTLKLRRQLIKEKYAEKIEKFYEE